MYLWERASPRSSRIGLSAMHPSPMQRTRQGIEHEPSTPISSTIAISSEYASRSRVSRMKYPNPALTPSISHGTSTIHKMPMARRTPVNT